MGIMGGMSVRIGKSGKVSARSGKYLCPGRGRPRRRRLALARNSKRAEGAQPLAGGAREREFQGSMPGQPGASAQKEHRATVAENCPDVLTSRYADMLRRDRKSTRLNSSHLGISYA